eukprot:NODE_118_length_18285_cov_1.016606.p3 type:complete len:977 gc:universal NODE_118_length_18285_cov_1.016606:6834-3904(-)
MDNRLISYFFVCGLKELAVNNGTDIFEAVQQELEEEPNRKDYDKSKKSFTNAPSEEKKEKPLVMRRRSQIIKKSESVMNEEPVAAPRLDIPIPNDEMTNEVKSVIKKRPKDPHPLSYKFIPTTLCTYPEQDEDYPVHVPMFCFPDDTTIHCAPLDNWSEIDITTQGISWKEPKPSHHSFIVTLENGTRLYGTTIIVWELIEGDVKAKIQKAIDLWNARNCQQSDVEYVDHIFDQIKKTRMSLERLKKTRDISPTSEIQDDIRDTQERLQLLISTLDPFFSNLYLRPERCFAPKAIGLLAKFPVYSLMKDWLSVVIRYTTNHPDLNNDISARSWPNDTPLERFLVSLINETPIPPPGKTEINLAVNDFNFYVSRPPLNKIPIMKNYSYYPLFCTLCPENIVEVIECILLESKILFVSDTLNLLCPTIECFLRFIYPFSWQHALIPILPERLLAYLEAPMPFIVGLERKSIPKNLNFAELEVVVVDLDYNTVRNPQKLLGLSEGRKRKLVGTLYKNVPTAIRLGEKSKPPSYTTDTYPQGNVMIFSGKSLIGEKLLYTREDSVSTIDTVSPNSKDNAVRNSISFTSLNGINEENTGGGFSNTVNRHSTFIRSSTFSPGFASKSSSEVKSSLKTAWAKMKKVSEISLPERELGSKLSLKDDSKSIASTRIESIHGMPKEVSKDVQSYIPSSFDEPQVEKTFLNFFAGLLKGYKAYVKKDADESYVDVDQFFDKQSFLLSCSKNYQPFLSKLMDTQHFAQFIIDRTLTSKDETDYEILFFDEIISLKVGKSKIINQYAKSEFIEDESLLLKETYSCPLPQFLDLDDSVLRRNKTIPITLKKELLQTIRNPPSLLQESDKIMMKVHLVKFNRQVRMQQDNPKSQTDVSKWLKKAVKAVSQADNQNETSDSGNAAYLEKLRELKRQRLNVLMDSVYRDLKDPDLADGNDLDIDHRKKIVYKLREIQSHVQKNIAELQDYMTE